MSVYSIIQKSQLEGALRLDAEYYRPEYLEISSKLRNNKLYRRFEEILAGGSYGTLPDSEDYIIDDDSKDDIYLIRGVDLRGLQIEKEYLVKVPVKYLNKRSKTKEGELLFLVKGATIDTEDSVSITPNLFKEAIFNGSIFRPVLKDFVLPEYAYVFMRTKYFYKQKRRLVSNVGIEYNSIFDIKNYDFIIPDLSFQNEIKVKVKETFNILNDSKYFYAQAENLLLEELGLKDFKVREDLTYTVNFSDLKSANRADAEYFQPKYENLISKIKKQDAKLLGDLVSMKKGFEPGSEAYEEEGKLFIRVSSLSKNGIEDKDQKFLSNDLYEKLQKDYEPKIGEILLTKDATPGIAYVLKEPVKGIISGGILRLKPKEEIDPEYLTICISSIVGQSQAERDAGGSIIAHWKPEQIKNLLIPILPQSTQQKIADLVKKSHESRKKAKELLKEAKRRVEEIIEE